MPGSRSPIVPFALAALLAASPAACRADAAPTWLRLVTLPVHSFGVRLDHASSPAADDRASAAAPRAVSTVSNKELCETLVSSAHERRLPVSFFTNLIWQESRFDSRTVSRAGAQGIAQFMPAVSKEVGLDNPFDPRKAIPAAARLLRALADKFGNLGLAAAAYNAGPGRVRDWIAKRGKLPSETRSYVVTITGHQADTWRASRRPASTAFAVPSGVPCHAVAMFAAATRSEQGRALASRQAKTAATGIPRRGTATRVAALKPHDRTRRKS